MTMPGVVAVALTACASTPIDPSCGLVGKYAGCVAGQRDSDTLVTVDWTKANAPICTTQSQCEIAWAAARQWVLDNAGYKLQQYSTDYMETYNSSDRDLAARVSKVPVGDGSYRIVAKLWCSTDYGCAVRPDKAVEGFYEYVGSRLQATKQMTQ
jgi:hypothetical protein